MEEKFGLTESVTKMKNESHNLSEKDYELLKAVENYQRKQLLDSVIKKINDGWNPLCETVRKLDMDYEKRQQARRNSSSLSLKISIITFVVVIIMELRTRQFIRRRVRR